ncbi:unnamed protein product [Rotaria sp. Silwood2]|nr:unnamed protein product [Rotaria sp. Silwood2]
MFFFSYFTISNKDIKSQFHETKIVFLFFQWDSPQAHVRWTHSFDETIDSKSSCSSEPNVVDVEQLTPPILQRPSALLRSLLNRQFLGYYFDQSTNEDSSPEE